MRGDTLIEVLIALAIASVVISGITVLGTTSLSNARFVASQDQATKYAQEGIEIVRQIRNSGYVNFANYNGVYCLGQGATSLGAAGASCTTVNIDNAYIRSVQIAQNDGCGVNLAHAIVAVSWTDGKCASGIYCHSSKLSSCFSTLPPIPAP